jgi:hypothetical protein
VMSGTGDERVRSLILAVVVLARRS